MASESVGRNTGAERNVEVSAGGIVVFDVDNDSSEYDVVLIVSPREAAATCFSDPPSCIIR